MVSAHGVQPRCSYIRRARSLAASTQSHPVSYTEILQARAAALAQAIDADETALARAEADGTLPVFLSEHRYQLALRRAEHEWLDSFTQALRTGTMRWPSPHRVD